MRVDIYSRQAIEKLLETAFPSNTAVISFYDPPGNFQDKKYKPVDYKGKATRLFQVAIRDIDLSVLPDYGLNYETYFPESEKLGEFIFQVKEDGMNLICQVVRRKFWNIFINQVFLSLQTTDTIQIRWFIIKYLTH